MTPPTTTTTLFPDFFSNHSIKSIHILFPSLHPSFLPSFFIYWSKTHCVPLLYPFTSPCLCLIHLSFFIHHAPSHFSLSPSPQVSCLHPTISPSSIISCSLFSSSFPPSISPGCCVLHPVITRLVNSFMASTLSVTHAGRMPARSRWIQLTRICTVGRRAFFFLNMQVNTKSTRKLAISGCEAPANLTETTH